jgi:hypothetical protein
MARTPETGGTIRIFDDNGIERVTIGEISDDEPPDMGIIVRDPSGLTEIIDGVSDVFRIVATGTLLTAAVGTNATSASTVDVTTGLTYAPAVIGQRLLAVGEVAEMPSVDVDVATGNIDIVLSLSTKDMGSGVTRVSLRFQNASSISSYGAGAFSVKYFVLAQPGS